MINKQLLSCLFIASLVAASCSGSHEEKSEPLPDSASAHLSVDTQLKGITQATEVNASTANGEYIKRYPNGVIQMRGSYLTGKRNGQWTSYYPDGKVQSEGFFHMGLRDGKAIVYYENGKVYYTGYYNKGKETGEWTFYDEQGNVLTKKDYGQSN